MDGEPTEVEINPAENREKSPEKQASRQKVIKAFEESFSLFDSYVSDPASQATDEERKNFAFITQAKGRTDLKKGRDTYQNRFFGEQPNEVYVESEGVPVEQLIAFLRRQAAETKDSTARRRHLKNAQILEDNSRLFYDIHSSMDPAAIGARENQEAQLFSGDLDKAKEVLKNRRELFLPPEKPKPPKQPERPELTIGLVAGKQRIRHEIEGGKTRGEMEVLEERAREIARLQMTEDRTKWEGRFSFIRQFIPRLWKSTIGEVATYNKEKSHAIRLLAESGIQMTTLPHSFMEQVDSLARQNIARKRSGIRQRVWGTVRDIFHEATFTEKDLHQERINIIRQLRQAADHIADPNEQEFLQSHSLGKQFIDILNGDYQASEALAKRVNSEYGDALIHGTVGEKRGQEAVTLEGPIADFFKHEIITPLLQEGLANGGISENTILQSREKMQEFFFSERFLVWYNDPKNQEIRNSLNLSLSYGSDLIPLIQEVLLPQALQAVEHLRSTRNLESYIKGMVLKVNVGTLEAGQKGIIEEGLLERAASRTITNERVMQLYERLRTGNNAPRIVPYTYLNAAANRANLLGSLGRVATHQILMGAAVGVGLYAARAGAGTVSRLVVPVLGGSVVAGAFRAMQERRMFTREHEQHEVETELGYQFPKDAQRREQMRSLELHKREMQKELIVPMQRIISDMESGTVSKEKLMELAGLVADTQARFRIMDVRNIGLLAASSPQNYQVEKTSLEMTQAKASVLLKNYLETHPELGLQNLLVSALIDELSEIQIDHLERGAGIDARYQAALGNLSIEQTQSIDAREKAFRSARTRRMAVAGLTTAAGAIGGYLLTHAVIDKAAGLAASSDIPMIRQFAEAKGLLRDIRSDKLGGVNLKEAFDHPQSFRIEDPNSHEQFTMVVRNIANNPDKQIDLFDLHGKHLEGPPIFLQSDGEHTRLVVAGSADNLPGSLKNMLQGWHSGETNDHNLKVYMDHLTSGDVKNTPDQVLGQGSFSMNTHDVDQSRSLNPDHLSYDEWAAKMGRINPATGDIEQGKMSITLKPDALHPDGIRLHGFLREDGSFDASKDFYIGPEYPSNTDLTPEDLQTLTEKLHAEGWTVEQTPTGYHITPPSATEYFGMEKQYIGTNSGVPFLTYRRPMEGPEEPKTPQPNVEQKNKDELEARKKYLQTLPGSEENNRNLAHINEQLARINQQPLTAGFEYHPKEIFEGIKGDVDRGHEYFVEDPPSWIDKLYGLEIEELTRKLELRLPFFVDIKQEPNGNFTMQTNKDVVPFVWALLHRSERYANAEWRTKGDSGLLALAAVSAETSEMQSRLYMALVNTIMAIHQQNPELLSEWWDAQGRNPINATVNGQPVQISSKTFFEQNDAVLRQGHPFLRPEEERLVYEIGNFKETWQRRMTELRAAVANNYLQPHHLRWIEFLSHSVDVAELMRLMKQQTASITQPAPTEEPQITPASETSVPAEKIEARVETPIFLTSEQFDEEYDKLYVQYQSARTTTEKKEALQTLKAFIQSYGDQYKDKEDDPSKKEAARARRLQESMDRQITKLEQGNKTSREEEEKSEQTDEQTTGQQETPTNILPISNSIENIISGSVMNLSFIDFLKGITAQLTPDKTPLEQSVLIQKAIDETRDEINRLESPEYNGLLSLRDNSLIAANRVREVLEEEQKRLSAQTPQVTSTTPEPQQALGFSPIGQSLFDYVTQIDFAAEDHDKFMEIVRQLVPGLSSEREEDLIGQADDLAGKMFIDSMIKNDDRSRKIAQQIRNLATGYLIKILFPEKPDTEFTAAPVPTPLPATPTEPVTPPSPPQIQTLESAADIKPHPSLPQTEAPEPQIQTLESAADIEPSTPPPTREVISGNLIESINQNLAKNTKTESYLATSPQVLIEYLKTLKFPLDAKILDASYSFSQNGNLLVHANLVAKQKLMIKTITVKPTADIVIGNDPSGQGITIISYKLDNLGPLEGIAKKFIGPSLTGLNNTISENINLLIIPLWEVSNFRISDGKINIDFRKRL